MLKVSLRTIDANKEPIYPNLGSLHQLILIWLKVPLSQDINFLYHLHHSHTANMCPNDFITSDFSTSAQVSETQPDVSALKKLKSTPAIFPRVLGTQPDQTLLLSLSHTWTHMVWENSHIQNNNRQLLTSK